MLESSIESEVCDIALKQLGVPNIKLKNGANGWPDRMFLIPGGRPLIIEFKRPGEEPRKLQAYIHKNLKKLGYDIETHDDKEEALASIKKHMEAAQGAATGRKVHAAKRRGGAVLGSRSR